MEQEGVAGTCSPQGLLGCRAARGVLTTALPGAFGTPNGIRVSGAADGTWVHRWEEMIPLIPAVRGGPDGLGLCRFLRAA